MKISPFLYLENRGHNIGPAKGRPVLVVGLDIVMALGQEVGKLAVHFDLTGLIAPENSRDRQSDHIGKTVSPEHCR